MKLIYTFLSATILLFTGCGKSNNSDDVSGGGTPVVAKGGMASGHITRLDGKPIGIDGTAYDLAITGITGLGGNVTYAPKPDANGNWSTKLAPGIYHAPTCTARIPFNGQTYTYTLMPTAELGDTDSEKGISADFVWHMTGPHTYLGAKADPANHTNWFGGTCALLWDRNPQDKDGKFMPVLTPDGAKLVFTATPKGKAIDGSDPKPMVWERSFYKLLATVTPDGLNDMAPTTGGWVLSGNEVLADKSEFPLTFRLPTESVYAPTFNVEINAVTMDTTHPADGPTLWVLGHH